MEVQQIPRFSNASGNHYPYSQMKFTIELESKIIVQQVAGAVSYIPLVKNGFMDSRPSSASGETCPGVTALLCEAVY